MTIGYIAESLGDLAEAFEKFAGQEERLASRATSMRDKRLCMARARTWREAADVVRKTQIRADQSQSHLDEDQ